MKKWQKAEKARKLNERVADNVLTVSDEQSCALFEQ